MTVLHVGVFISFYWYLFSLLDCKVCEMRDQVNFVYYCVSITWQKIIGDHLIFLLILKSVPEAVVGRFSDVRKGLYICIPIMC